MAWDIESFLNKFRGGFDAGEQKRVEEQKLAQETSQNEVKSQSEQMDLEFKQQKNQLYVLKELAKLFEIGKKKKKNQDGTETEEEPNPVREMLLQQFQSGETPTTGMESYQENPMTSLASSINQDKLIPQDYNPEPQVDPYTAPKNKNSVATTTNDIVGKIANGGQEYMDSGNLEDYLKRFLNG